MYKCLPCTTQSCKCTLQKCVSINSVSHCFHKNVKYIYNFLCHIPALQISERSTCLGLHSWQIAALGFRGWQLAFISAHGPPYPAHYASQPHLCTSDILFSCEERKERKADELDFIQHWLCALIFYAQALFLFSLIPQRNSERLIPFALICM